MKILQINAVYKIGSTGRNVFEIHEYLKRYGHESYIAATHINKEDTDCFEIGNKFDWKIHGLLSRIKGTQGYFSKKATKQLIEYMEMIRPDIVHLNNLHGNYLNLPMLFSYLSSKQIVTVITLHDCWDYTGKCTHYTVQGCYKWQAECNDCPRLKKDNVSWFFDKTNLMLRDKENWYSSLPILGVIGVSDWITAEAKNSILRSALTIERIYNWINLDVFRPQKSKIEKYLKLNKKYDFIVLCVASKWTQEKGLDTIIEFANNIDPNVGIILVGDSQSKSLPNNIISINVTNDLEELVAYYNFADVFLQVSREETFGKVVAEALACGTPIITIDSTANKELVPANCGVVLSDLDVNTLLNALDKVKNNGKQYYSQNCRRFAENKFDIQKNLQKYIDLYECLLERKNNKSKEY